MKMKKAGKSLKRIVTATAVTIFSLFTGITGVYAWFNISTATTITASMFEVVNEGGVTLGNIQMYKFLYPQVLREGVYEDDIDHPELGEVKEFEFDPDKGTNGEFGYYDDSEPPVWVSTSAMNLYDPFNLILGGGDLYNLKCNVIYKIVLGVDDPAKTKVFVKAEKKTVANAKTLLSPYVDFDVYFEDSLTSADLYDQGDPLYIPNFVTKTENELEDEEKIYYKLSYLSNLEETHSHFYGQSESTINLIEPTTKDLSSGTVTLYINVNYSPDEVDNLIDELSAGDILTAEYDFSFIFGFEE